MWNSWEGGRVGIAGRNSWEGGKIAGNSWEGESECKLRR